MLVSFRWWVVTSSLSTWVATEVEAARDTSVPSPQACGSGVGMGLLGTGTQALKTRASEGPIGTFEV